MLKPRILALLTQGALLGLYGCDADDPGKDGDPTDDTADTSDTDDSGDTEDTEDIPTGCIQVDGAGSFGRLNDAIEAASTGSIITLCAGVFEESVIVDKQVTIRGAGTAATFWEAPDNADAFDLRSASGIRLESLTIRSARNGILVQGAGNATIYDVVIDRMASKGIHATKAVDLQVSLSTLSGCAEGGMLVEGGSVTVEASTLLDNTRFGARLNTAAEGTFSGNTIRGTLWTESKKEPVEDGHGVWAEAGSTLSFSDNTFSSNSFSAVAASDSFLSLHGDHIDGPSKESKLQSLVGIYQQEGTLELTNVTIENPSEFGILYTSLKDGVFEASGLTVRGDPELVADLSWEEIVGDDALIGSIGVLVQARSVQVSDSHIEGYNDWGMWLASPDETVGTATLSNVEFIDNGRTALKTAFLDVQAQDIVSTGLRKVAEPSFSDIYVDIQGAIIIYEGSLELERGSVENAQGWGVSGLLADLHISDSDFSGCERSAVMDFYGTSEITGSRFTAAASGETFYTIWAYHSEGMTLQSSSFFENYGPVSVDSSGTTIVYQDLGLDFGAFASRVNIIDNTFDQGDRGILLASSVADVTGNYWSEYKNYAIEVTTLTGKTHLPTETAFSFNTIENMGGYAFLCVGTVDAIPSFEISELDVLTQKRMTYDYDTYDSAGTLLSSGSVSDVTHTMYTALCDGSMDTVLFSDGLGPGAYLLDSTLSLEDVTFSQLNQESGTSDYTLQAQWSSTPVDLVATGLRVESPLTGSGVRIQQGSGGLAHCDLQDLEISGAPSYGLILSSVQGASFDGGAISNNGGDGLYSTSSSYELLSMDIQENGSNGLYASSGTVSVQSSEISGNGTNGLLFVSTTANIKSNLIHDNASSGLSATSGSLIAEGNTITDNGAYGMSCGASLSVGICSNTVSGNTTADNNGCPASCLEP